MRAVILAAGEGKRLRPLTNDRPKAMVEYQGKPILDYQLDLFSKNGVKDIIVVKGYKAESVDRPFAATVFNPVYDTTNMVYTFFCARKYFDDDVVVSYGDIIYADSILKSVITAGSDIAVAVSMNWRSLWEKRMEDPLNDAETLKMDPQSLITELGKKPKSYEEIQGQYMGLFKIGRSVLKKVVAFYDALDQKKLYDGQPFEKMYMTSFIQELIDNGFRVKAVPVWGEWLEIDKADDLTVKTSL